MNLRKQEQSALLQEKDILLSSEYNRRRRIGRELSEVEILVRLTAIDERLAVLRSELKMPLGAPLGPIFRG